MLKQTNTEVSVTPVLLPSPGTGLIRTLLLMVVMPLLSLLVEYTFNKITPDPAVIGKWFIFWAFGVRAFLAGLRQAFSPAFTTMRLFNLRVKTG